MLQLLALTVAVAGVLAALIGGAGAAGAADKPAPLHIPKLTLPKLGPAQTSHSAVPNPAPSHPLTVTVPGLATVTVNLPDLPTVLGGGRQSAGRTTAQPEATASAPSTGAVAAPDGNSASPDAPAPAATSAVPTGTATAATAAKPARTAAAASANRTGRATTSNDAAGTSRPLQVAHTAPAHASKPPARPVADAFQGMLHTGLPIWLLVGIVVMCGGGTVIVVRSGRRPAQSGRR